jgi:5-methylcytosine-specific restriction protein A
MKKICGRHGCNELVEYNESRCQLHLHDRRYNDRLGKKNRKDKEIQDIYTDIRWIKLRDYKRRMDPLCEKCTCNVMSDVHHIVPIKLGGAIYDLSNLMSLCRKCHNEIHRR